MITLYIWKPGDPKSNEWFHLKSGHVAMLVNGVYYSFYPKDKNHEKSNVGLVKTEVAQIIGRTTGMDAREAKYDHDIEFNILGLDEEAVVNYWGGLVDRKQHYHLTRFNCCVAAAQALHSGFIKQNKNIAETKPITDEHFSILLDWTLPSRKEWPSTIERIKKGLIYATVATVTPRLLSLFASYIDNHLNNGGGLN